MTLEHYVMEFKHNVGVWYKEAATSFNYMTQTPRLIYHVFPTEQ